MRRKHIPMRRCVGCRTSRPKNELIRVVRSPDGEVTIDPTGKKSGRGAYICPLQDCLEKSVQGRQLERALKVKISPEVLVDLKRVLDEENL
ncbi:MAG TPA: YlxR family protein [Firmicutes bacterium]|nr:YlxR family protein [Bacillota bacterium]